MSLVAGLLWLPAAELSIHEILSYVRNLTVFIVQGTSQCLPLQPRQSDDASFIQHCVKLTLALTIGNLR